MRSCADHCVGRGALTAVFVLHHPRCVAHGPVLALPTPYPTSPARLQAEPAGRRSGDGAAAAPQGGGGGGGMPAGSLPPLPNGLPMFTHKSFVKRLSQVIACKPSVGG